MRCGSSGSGKSWGVKEAIKKASRIIIFDPDDEYGELERVITVYTARDLHEWVRRYPKGALRIRYIAGGVRSFDLWAETAFAWCNCVAVAEEIAGVTSPGKAPPGWHKLVSRGRKRGVTIFAVTQRPAEADKTVMGNATTLRTGRLTRANDRKYLAAEMDIDVSQISNLLNLDFIEVDMGSNTAYQGKMGTKVRRKIR